MSRRALVVCCLRLMAWRASTRVTIAAFAAVMLVLSGCGSGARQDANEPSGNFTVGVVRASFPRSQQLAESTHLVIAVRNTGSKTIPNLAVTICNISCGQLEQPGSGSGAQAFATNIDQPGVANPSRPVWIIDHPPGLCGYSCASGGPGAYVTAYTNTWAAGALRPGATAVFDWAVTALRAGRHVVAYQVAAGLNGKARAVLADGSAPTGSFQVTISNQPQQAYVNNQGQVVPSK